MPSISDVEGIEVGHASDFEALTGCTVILCRGGAVAGVDPRGGACGTRSLDSLDPAHLVEKIHGICLAGGSAFGLDATGGVMKWLEEHGVGFGIGPVRVPIVPSAILFDLWIGDSKRRPDRAMGYAACANASKRAPEEGSVGAGTGATVGKVLGVAHAMKGGVGSWFVKIENGVGVGALSVVNAWGDVREPDTGRVLAGARKEKEGREFLDTDRFLLEEGWRIGGGPRRGQSLRQTSISLTPSNTTLSVVATDAGLTKAQAHRVAVMAHDGFARTISPVHTLYDGDIVFVLSTGPKSADVNRVGAAAASVVAESIVRAVKRAKSLGGVPSL